MKNKERKLKNLLIRDFQIRILAHSLLYFLAAFFLTGWVILSPLALGTFLAPTPDLQAAELDALLSVSARILPGFAILMILFVIHIIRLTHRIGGPMVNFIHTFKRLEQGDLTRRVFIRHGDYLKQESLRINSMIDGLEKRFTRIHLEHGQMKELILELSQFPHPENSRLADLLRELKHTSDRMESELTFLRVQESD